MYNDNLADRCREIISLTHSNVEEKKMFGGLCFMVNEKMCVGVVKEELLVLINPEIFNEVIEKDGCRPMDFTGKSMKGFVFVNETGLDNKNKLEFWVQLALDYNTIAKASKKNKVSKKKN